MYKILIIDDSQEFRDLIGVYIKKSEHDCELVEYDPLAKGRPPVDFNWSDYDLLLLDYNLGEQNGLEWLEDLIKSPDFPATVFLTAYGDEEVAVQAMKLGVHDYLRKQDLSKEKLLETIQRTVTIKSSYTPHHSSKRHFFDSLITAANIKNNQV